LSVLVHNKKDILCSISEIGSLINSTYYQTCLSQISRSISKSVVQNTLYYQHASKKPLESTILEIINRAAFACESRSPGSGDLFVTILSYMIEEFISKSGKRSEKIEKINNEILNFCHHMSTQCHRLDSKKFNLMVRHFLDNKDLESIVFKAFSISSPNSQIKVQKTNKEKTRINKISGNSFHIDSPHIAGNEWNKKNVKSIIIDGEIETVGEIHHFLKKASDEKFPHLIIARKISKDIQSTILLNNARGTLDCQFIEIGYTQNTAHTIKDLEIIFDCDIISQEKGDVISKSIKNSEFTIDHIILKDRNFVVSTEKSEKINNHIRELIFQKNNFDVNLIHDKENIVINLLDSRIKSLSSDLCIIEVGNDIIRIDDRAFEKMDKLLRMFIDASNFGIVKIKNNKKIKLSGFLIKNSDNKLLTQHQLFDACITTSKTCKLLVNSGLALTNIIE
tara:strand:+ start:19981 stop:21333 length:1353 start_codon:yes stop_codon:yes gene_type:complete